MRVLHLFVFVLLSISCVKAPDLENGEDDCFNCHSNSEIVFISRRIENSSDWQIYIMDCNGDNQRKLVDIIVDCHKPVASNDGGKIAFTTYKDQERKLYIVDRDGEDLRLISSGKPECGGISFSPDDTKILYFKNDNVSDRACNLYINDIKGAYETKITSHGHNYAPSWLLSGAKILFTSSNDSTCGIYSINLDGSERKRLTPEDKSYGYPVPSPDGNYIAMTSCDREGSQIFVMKRDSASIRQLTFSVSPGWWDTGFPRKANENPVWSPSGNKIAYVSHDFEYPNIYTMNPDGLGKKKLTNQVAFYPYWSTEGEHLIYTSGREIQVMDQNGWRKFSLTNKQYSDAYPIWLP